MLEVCIDSLESAVNAIHGGADELELCSSLAEGGLTPSAGLVTAVLCMIKNISLRKPVHKSCFNCSCQQLTKKPKINIMVRCRTGSEFCYTEYEMDTMMADVQSFKQMKVDRFVFGALNINQEIHEDNCSKIINEADPIPVTFHRAFDICKEPLISMKKIIDLGFSRLLTSGQKSSAGDSEALKLIKILMENYGDVIEIMPGAGVNADNARIFIELGCKIVHSSCKKNKQLPPIQNNLSMGTSDSECIYVAAEDIVRSTKNAIIS